MKKISYSYRQDGFTLIELSIVMVIVGLMVAGFIQAYTIYDAKQKIERMNSYMVDVAQALQSFPTLIDPATITASNPSGDLYGRMPCPAPMDGTTFGNAYSSEQNPPNCNGALNVNTPNGRVFIGKIPAGTLKLSNGYMKDSFDNYLIYAVSAGAVSSATYSTTAGAITIREKEINPANGNITELPPKTNIQYALISPGQTGIGALDFTGALRFPCDDNNDESENCLDTTKPATIDATFLVSVRGDRNSSLFYDDYVRFEASLPFVAANSEPQFCNQQEVFQTSGSTCPDGWEEDNTVTGDVVSTTDGDGSYYNVDPDTGDYYFTPFETSNTKHSPEMANRFGNQLPSSNKITCKKSASNTAKTRCSTKTVSVPLFNRSGPNSYDWRNQYKTNDYIDETKCPAGYKAINAVRDESATTSCRDGRDGDNCSTTLYLSVDQICSQ